jgi:Ti-type conjugative transfer relaxase TraA
MGIPLEPQKKLGPLKHMSKEDAAETDRMKEYLETCRRNGERIKANPAIATDLFSKKQAIFTENDIYRLANTYSADKVQFDEVVFAIKSSPDLVILGAGEDRKERYTTRQTLEAENSMLSKSESMAKTQNHKVKEKYQKQAKASRTLSPEQVKAFDHIFSSGDMSCVVGYAGTGKSYMLDAVREAYEAGGYTVTGTALAGIAAQGLFQSSGIPSQTIARKLIDIQEGRSQLTDRHVLVIDAAGMVGTRQMNALVSHAHEKGAKVIMVGDGMQLQPIEAGGAFRGIYSRTGGVNLTEIRRQKENWQKEATKFFEEGKTKTGLDLYQTTYKIFESHTQNEAIQHMINNWTRYVDQTKAVETTMMMAYRNKDVDDLNRLGRESMIRSGFVKEKGKVFETVKGVKEFAEGDRILFLKNDRFMGVNNGNRGTVEKISGNDFLVRMDNNEQIAFDAAKYNHFNHGYAATVHKLQGATIRQSFVLADSFFDQHTTLTAMSRHTDDAILYYSRERFQDGYQELRRVLSRKRPKELAIDFADKRGIDPSHAFDDRRQRDTFFANLIRKKDSFIEFFSDIFRSNEELDILTEVQEKQKEENAKKLAKANEPPDPAEEAKKFKELMAGIYAGANKERQAMVQDVVDGLISQGLLTEPHRIKMSFDEPKERVCNLEKGVEPGAKDRENDFSGHVELINKSDTEPRLTQYRSQIENFMASEAKREAELVAHMKTEQKKEKTDSIKLPVQADRDVISGRKYLYDVLDISRTTLTKAERAGFIRYSSKGIIFAGYDSQGEPRNASLASTSNPDKITQRRIAGSDKIYPQVLPGNPKSVWIMDSGFDALILHDMALRQHKEPPTVIIASGADISACLKNQEVIHKIKSADNFILAKERAEDPAKQFVIDQNYSKQALKIKQLTGKEAGFYTPPENVKNMAEYNKAQIEAQKEIARKNRGMELER